MEWNEPVWCCSALRSHQLLARAEVHSPLFYPGPSSRLFGSQTWSQTILTCRDSRRPA